MNQKYKCSKHLSSYDKSYYDVGYGKLKILTNEIVYLRLETILKD